MLIVKNIKKILCFSHLQFTQKFKCKRLLSVYLWVSFVCGLLVLLSDLTVARAEQSQVIDTSSGMSEGTKETEISEETTYQEHRRGVASDAHPLGVYANLTAPGWFGLTVAVERGFRLKEHSIAPGVRIRSLNLGWIASFNVGDESNFKWGVGGALGVRFYFVRKPSPLLKGFYFGLWGEYIHVAGNRPAYTWDVGAIGPQAEVGYRWRIRRFIIGLGLSGGFFFKIFNRRQYWNDYKQSVDNTGRIPNLGLDLEMGWTF